MTDIDVSEVCVGQHLARPLLPIAGGASLAIATALTIQRAHDLREIVVVLAVLVPVTLGVFGFLLPRKLRLASAPTAAMALAAIAGTLLLPAFWSGLPLVLGVAAALLGYAGRNAERGSRRCTAALVIGTLSALGYLAVYLLDWLLPAGG